LKLNTYKTFKQFIFGCLVLTLICIHTSSTAQEPKRVALMPFKVNAEKDLTFLKDGIFDMLTSRLSSPGKVEVLDRKDVETAVEQTAGSRAIDENLARTIGQQVNADFVLFGSLTVFGNSVSIDAKMVDVAARQPTMAFFDQSQDLGAVITKINLIAADINANLFGRAPVTRQSAAQPAAPSAPQPAPQKKQSPSGDQEDIHAHPEKLLRDGRTDEEGLYADDQGTRVLHNKFWRSASFKYLINGVSVGDVDGDRLVETVIIQPHEVIIFRSEKGKFFKTAELAKSKTSYYIGVDVADINGNGYAEIFVTSLNNLKNTVGSLVIEYDGKNYNSIVEDSPWYYRTVNLSERGQVLIGQQGLKGKPYSGGIFEMAWENANYVPLTEIKTPVNLNVLGLSMGDITNSREETVVAYKQDDRLLVFDPAGEELWTGVERHGGSMLFYSGPQEQRGEVENRLYFPMRTRVMQGKDKTTEVIAVKNFELTGMKLEFRNFTEAQIESLSWTGLGLAPDWKTRKITGQIRDFALGDFDNDGTIELVAAVIQKQGAVAFTIPKSVLIAYDLKP
jgi:TolB-like protein